jgi:mono/diheme cytochrome c family protein
VAQLLIRRGGAALFGLLLTAAAAAAQPQDPAVQRGLNFVRTNCARCHAIDKLSPSPLKAAPPFRTLHQRYPIDSLAEAMAEGIVTGHPSMPEFRLDPDQISDVLAFLQSLQQ